MKFKRRRKANKQILLTQAFLLLLLFIGIGYSILNTNLGINGTVQLSKKEQPKYLYDVIKTEAESGSGLAKKYTGEHNDTLNNTGTQDIYYYTGDVREKFNVKLGNMCFQMLRTTDSGGVKLIYNGEYDETNKCNDSRTAHKGVVGTYGSRQTLNQSYMYGDTYSYDITTGNFTLQNTTTSTWSDSTAENLIGKYTCKTTGSTCTTLYGVNEYYSATTAYTTSYTIGDTAYSQIGTTSFNANYLSPAMVGYMYNTVYNAQNSRNKYGEILFGKSVTYSNGTYTLTDASTTVDKYHYYTCNNTAGTCETVYYITWHEIENWGEADGNISVVNYGYMKLTNGKTIDDAINEMLYNDNVNTKNSYIKILIDAWYKNNMTSYTNYLEDVVYCNDRSSIDNGKWHPSSSIFKNYNLNNDLYCANETDRFSLANNKAKLDYPVGLATSPEMNLINNNTARNTGQGYWLLSPYDFVAYDGTCRVSDIYSGVMSNNIVDNANGVRPAVSLATGTEFTSGTGTKSDPYVIKLD